MKNNYPRDVLKRRHKMSYPARHELLSSLRERYLTVCRQEKSIILDELCKSTGFHRKHAIRALNNLVEKQYYREKRGRKNKYDDPNLILILKDLRISVGNTCAELFHPQMPEAIKLYEKWREKIADETKKLILSISKSTLKRRLPGAYRAKSGVIKHYKQASKLCGQIPLQKSYPKPKKPGCLEIDLVEHNGGDPSGQYLYTFTSIDKVTNWVIRKCINNKSAHCVHGAMNYTKNKMPYSIFWIDTDNGSEFLNSLVIKWTIENDYLFTRSRAGKKNDNAHVERANRVYVRELIGYARFTSSKAFELINKIYLIDEMYVNFFVPGRKITEKIYNRATGKSRKIFDKPLTAYNRVLEHYSQTDQGEEICKPLQEVYNSLDPWELLSERNKLMRQLGRLKK